ncbi:MAG: bifunctional UDP-N-acetylmuramoyl-tripeptide:D-alanyl-D-alanine ligase/alanine racemase [Chitinophagaceae bacterium]
MYSIEAIRTIVKGKWLQQGAGDLIEYLLPDSRKLSFPASSLFFALKGPRRDGHAFLQEAYDKGVRNFIVSTETGSGLPAGANIIIVKDVLQALQLLAAYHRQQFSYPVIGITGSNGKTIVKEWLNQLLEEKFLVVRSPKSYNSQIGVPLSVWQMNDQYNLGLFEAGISQSGEMDKLEKMIQPGIGIFTNIGAAHSEGFFNMREKVKEKLQLFTHVHTLIYCKDYPELNESVLELVQQRNHSAKKMHLFTWSTKTTATFRVITLIKSQTATHITAVFKEETLSFKIPFTDDASVENAVTCYCVLLQLGIGHPYIQERMLELVPLAMRLELKKGINNCSIINDSYSADLSSLKIALDFLARQQQHPRRTVILSDIPESGKSENELYKEVAAVLQEKKVNRFIGIGPQLLQHKAIFEKTGGPEISLYANLDAFKKDFYHLKFQHETILLKGARVFEFEQILPLLEQQVHQTVLEINLSAMLHNLQQYQQLLKPATKLMAMVKAYSYGSGSYEIASLLQFHKADYLAVAYADEGIELRKAGITLPIMVINPEATSFEALIQFNLEPDIWSFGLLNAFDEYLAKEGLQQFPVHVELETGMNRLGFNVADMDKLAAVLNAGCCRVQSVFTHLVASEDPGGDNFTLQQADRYFSAVAVLENALPYTFLKHMTNSAAIVRYPQLQLDMVRLGIGLYGIDSAASRQLNLKEVSTLKTTIAQIKHLKKGETAGYGRKGIATRDSVIATVRLGYADGYPRRLSNGKGKMLVNGKLAPVIGIISMDMTMLDITGIPNVQEGDEVVVFGHPLSVQEVAAWAETIPYEIMTGIAQRVKRVYFEE